MRQQCAQKPSINPIGKTKPPSRTKRTKELPEDGLIRPSHLVLDWLGARWFARESFPAECHISVTAEENFSFILMKTPPPFSPPNYRRRIWTPAYGQSRGICYCSRWLIFIGSRLRYQALGLSLILIIITLVLLWSAESVPPLSSQKNQAGAPK